MKFALTRPFPCSYLPQQQEQLIVLSDEYEPAAELYGNLLAAGFRRSGEHIYRPHCPSCSACESIRIPVAVFSPSSSQKRILKRNTDIDVTFGDEDIDSYYNLYERYIGARHAEGSMYPPSLEQYRHFIGRSAGNMRFIEFHQEDKLVGVAVTDEVPDALSALYTFFDPECEKRSMGTFAILKQIEMARQMDKEFLYLGYQVDDCAKMNYKANFLPHQRFINHQWHLVVKKHG
ncbi:arginyltransferase [Aliiglaciecola sp. CAU 1673]|uniref:arginyltransferase n=1 Tax=Aliiglaciecola sp. CAU 1673 TaxID=3032595 RepID=UPI0023DA8EC4|nr:arginyltransferase [Aliiglaciecola sp. CAU 1673]MDF2177712.1 arginyltransferase [Aliiglaciecola sp. CAU 1673]